ncbi:ubiquinone/menaquinone biosynthesis methyltransferase [Rubritalea marina]|uniref:ubiquinone/menaquinone biosynthesis methyltransferase n=1 Tax=Rubritalea marina TaxID=361055 RepID=UPI00037F7F42|nr:ubiquinone/menaquinone biosynthesis methyltransferase [Rubritalea marina]
MQDPGFVKDAFSKIADRYVLTNHVLSMGTDILWRKKVGRIVSNWAPENILDVATGTGDLALELQKACPDAELLASDFCPEMLAHAKDRGVRQTMVVDAMQMPFDDDTCDVLTVAFGLRNMADYPAALSEMRRVIRPGGHVLVLDFSIPTGLLEKPYAFYLNKVLPKIAGVLTGEEEAYSYLAGSIADFPSGQKMLELIEDQGYSDAQWIPLTGGIASVYIASA